MLRRLLYLWTDVSPVSSKSSARGQRGHVLQHFLLMGRVSAVNALNLNNLLTDAKPYQDCWLPLHWRFSRCLSWRVAGS